MEVLLRSAEGLLRCLTGSRHCDAGSPGSRCRCGQPLLALLLSPCIVAAFSARFIALLLPNLGLPLLHHRTCQTFAATLPKGLMQILWLSCISCLSSIFIEAARPRKGAYLTDNHPVQGIDIDAQQT